MNATNITYKYTYLQHVMFNHSYSTSPRIWLDDLNCQSDDDFLLLCDHRGIGVENCGHSEDIELTCSKLSCECVCVCVHDYYIMMNRSVLKHFHIHSPYSWCCHCYWDSCSCGCHCHNCDRGVLLLLP